MPSTMRKVSLFLLACSLTAVVVSTAALSVPGSPASRELDGNHGSTRWLRRTSEEVPEPESTDAEEAGEEVKGEEEVDPSKNDQCWIFMHLQKCGGTTIKSMLKDNWGSEYFIYDSMRWKLGDEFSLEFAERLATGSPYKVMAGGYPEALRRSPAVDSTCRFFTMFRHPIERMVSAYFYCQRAPGDVACASEIVRAREVDLLTFAKHWSNFAVRQFALTFVAADDVLEYVETPEARALLPETVHDVKQVSGWYLLKMYLERPDAAAAVRGVPGQPELELETPTAQAEDEEEEEQEEVPDARLYQFLQPAQDLLSDGYAAVGLLEDFNTTLSLFDAALDMPGMKWHQEYDDTGGAKNVMGEKLERDAVLEKAWTDSELKRYMQLDLLLYEHAVDVFHQQARSYGLL